MYVYNFLYGNGVFMPGCGLTAIREHWQWLKILKTAVSCKSYKYLIMIKCYNNWLGMVLGPQVHMPLQARGKAKP